MNQQELQALVEKISIDSFDRPFRHQATFNKRLKTTGGRYHLRTHDLDFNPQVLEVYGEEELIGVIKHELCHYHLHLTGRGYHHRDKDFKELLQAVGGTRYVQSLRSVQVKKVWQYRCGACDKLYIRQRRFDTSKYVCGECSGKLHLIGQEEI